MPKNYQYPYIWPVDGDCDWCFHCGDLKKEDGSAGHCNYSGDGSGVCGANLAYNDIMPFFMSFETVWREFLSRKGGVFLRGVQGVTQRWRPSVFHWDNFKQTVLVDPDGKEWAPKFNARRQKVWGYEPE